MQTMYAKMEKMQEMKKCVKRKFMQITHKDEKKKKKTKTINDWENKKPRKKAKILNYAIKDHQTPFRTCKNVKIPKLGLDT